MGRRKVRLGPRMQGAATLEFLLAEYQEELSTFHPPSSEGTTWVCPNPMVAFTCKRGPNRTFLLSMLSVSALTQAEYFRFQIYCPQTMWTDAHPLTQRERVSW